MKIPEKDLEEIRVFQKGLNQDLINKGLKLRAALSDVYWTSEFTSEAGRCEARIAYDLVDAKFDELGFAAMGRDSVWANSGWEHMLVLISAASKVIDKHRCIKH